VWIACTGAPVGRTTFPKVLSIERLLWACNVLTRRNKETIAVVFERVTLIIAFLKKLNSMIVYYFTMISEENLVLIAFFGE
jgi:hypothetical protein